jgi:hypothetical protein
MRSSGVRCVRCDDRPERREAARTNSRTRTLEPPVIPRASALAAIERGRVIHSYRELTCKARDVRTTYSEVTRPWKQQRTAKPGGLIVPFESAWMGLTPRNRPRRILRLGDSLHARGASRTSAPVGVSDAAPGLTQRQTRAASASTMLNWEWQASPRAAQSLRADRPYGRKPPRAHEGALPASDSQPPGSSKKAASFVGALTMTKGPGRP